MFKDTSLPASVSTFSRIVTNDLFLAAFLYAEGCDLFKIYRNGRNRVSFVFVGNRVERLKKAFQEEKVSLRMGVFRDCLNLMRDLTRPAERSHSCPQESQTVP